MIICCFNIISVAEASAADIKKQCVSLFETPGSFPSKALQQAYKAVGSWSVEVPFHVLNTDMLLAHLAQQPPVVAHMIAFEKGIDRDLEQLCLKKFNTCFVIVESKKAANGKSISFVVKDVTGRWFEISGQTSILPDRINLDFSKYKFVQSENQNFFEFKRTLTEIYNQQKFSDMNAGQLASHLADIQLNTSTNAANTTGTKHEEYISGIRKANSLLGNILVNDEKVTRQTLEELNRSANEGVNPYELKMNAPLAGVTRGSNNQHAVIDGKLLQIDLRQFEVAQQWRFSGTSGINRLNYFSPAAEVLPRLEQLLVRINRISTTSDPLEIFSIYKEFVHIHPFADGNGRTARMLLNFLLLKAQMPPAERPVPSLFYRSEDIYRKYLNQFKKKNGSAFSNTTITEKIDFTKIKSFEHIADLKVFAQLIKEHYGFSKVTLENLHGTKAFLFVGVYQGRFIQFESTHAGAELSDSVDTMIKSSQKIIDQQAIEATQKDQPAPTYALYPELLEQSVNYHLTYQKEFLVKSFLASNGHLPSQKETESLQASAQWQTKNIIEAAQSSKSDQHYFEIMMKTPRVPDQVSTIEQMANRLMTITSPEYKQKIFEAITVKASRDNQESFIDIYNAFNSQKFDVFMITMAERALVLCRHAGACGPQQRKGIPDKYLAQVLKQEASQLDIIVETVSRYVGREPGRLFIQRIRRGSLLIDDGAPGNHGMLPHALQNLFIYQQIGKARAQKFFSELTGWTYERMFDSNAAFTPIPSSRDITRRHYWTGVFKAGNRSEVSSLGVLVGEAGRYPGFLRENNLQLVAVEETEKDLLSDGSVIRARYKNTEFTFNVDKDGVPTNDAMAIVTQIKQQSEN